MGSQNSWHCHLHLALFILSLTNGCLSLLQEKVTHVFPSKLLHSHKGNRCKDAAQTGGKRKASSWVSIWDKFFILCFDCALDSNFFHASICCVSRLHQWQLPGGKPQTNHTPKQTDPSSPTPRQKLLKTQMKKYHRNWSDHKLVKSKFYNKSSSLVFNISLLSKPCTHRRCLTLICTRKSLKCSLKALKSWSKLKRPSMNSLICGLQINKQHNW